MTLLLSSYLAYFIYNTQGISANVQNGSLWFAFGLKIFNMILFIDYIHIQVIICLSHIFQLFSQYRV